MRLESWNYKPKGVSGWYLIIRRQHKKLRDLKPPDVIMHILHVPQEQPSYEIFVKRLYKLIILSILWNETIKKFVANDFPSKFQHGSAI